MLPHPSTGKSGQAPHYALSCCSRMVCKDTTQAQDWAIYLPAFPQFHPTVHLLVRQTLPFSRWQHGRDTVGCCGPHGDEDRQAWLSLTSPRLQFHGSGHLWQCLKSSLCSFGIFFFWGAQTSEPRQDPALLGQDALADLQGHNVWATATSFTPSARHTWPSLPGDLTNHPQCSCFFRLPERIGLLSG